MATGSTLAALIERAQQGVEQAQGTLAHALRQRDALRARQATTAAAKEQARSWMNEALQRGTAAAVLRNYHVYEQGLREQAEQATRLENAADHAVAQAQAAYQQAHQTLNSYRVLEQRRLREAVDVARRNEQRMLDDLGQRPRLSER